MLGEPMVLTRRQAMAGFGAGLALLKGSPAMAEAVYPNRTIKMIVPYPAGGTTDFLGRLVAEQIQTGLGAAVIVENKPGAGTTLGAEQVARAAPDGYTLLMGDPGRPWQHQRYDALHEASCFMIQVKDFTPDRAGGRCCFKRRPLNPSLPA